MSKCALLRPLAPNQVRARLPLRAHVIDSAALDGMRLTVIFISILDAARWFWTIFLHAPQVVGTSLLAEGHHVVILPASLTLCVLSTHYIVLLSTATSA